MAKIELPVFECLRCGHKWVPRKQVYGHGASLPISCPKCRSWYWDAPLGAQSPQEAEEQINKARGS